jgi:hypothetical protein
MRRQPRAIVAASRASGAAFAASSSGFKQYASKLFVIRHRPLGRCNPVYLRGQNRAALAHGFVQVMEFRDKGEIKWACVDRFETPTVYADCVR